ncbi:sugar transferase [Aegicerativicinus sediminis]|uniref:sugar transferase n=1 Tax=Aegicerativicinus sediminis TaxID=2893202 RepID=UPI001E29BC3B|nr:sugar transferase [Aegicerativicinus sediminis]
MYKRFVKPTLDLLLSGIGILAASPILLLLILALYVEHGGKPFFFQKRAGKNGKPFTMVKFRTMKDKFDEDGNVIDDNKRITLLGYFLRKYSLDELPQLYNVVRGEMSLIGPRPLLPVNLGYYTHFQKHRHDVKPGITGLAQVNGRNLLSWERKFKYDVFYTRKINYLLDFKILCLTFITVISQKGIYNEVQEIGPEFADLHLNESTHILVSTSS